MTVLRMWMKVFAFLGVLAVISYRSWHYLPKPLPLDAESSVFSEARAKQHIVALADTIGQRQVGTYGVKQASDYLLDQLEQIQALAEKTRDDLNVEVEVQTVSGSYHLDLFMTPVYLTYSGLDNLLLRITPDGVDKTAGALLVNAHFDTAIGSPGAADCASCTAIAIETARAIVADKDLKLNTPIVILLNGGEETYMNAVHGFVTQHEWARSVSHFVNIESTGSYGPDVVFRSNSHLLLSAYLASSQSPRANVVFQDIFDLGLMPAETDYAVLAHNSTSRDESDGRADSAAKTTVYGDLEGIDIASMFDSRSYHTRLDETKRMPPGVTQNFGDNILALVKEASNMMHDSSSGAGDGEEDTAVKDSVYFDVLALFVVAYPFSLGKLLHSLPFLITLVAMSLVRLQSNIPLLGGIVTFMFSFILSIVFSAAAFASIALYVKPMSWYGRHYISALVFIPASLTGMLTPYIFAYTQPSILEKIRSKSQKLGQVLIGHVLGSCFILSGLGAYTTYGGLRHSGYLFGFWVISSLGALAYKCFYLQQNKSGVKKVTSSRKRQLVNGKPSDYAQKTEESFDVLDTLIIHLPALIICGHMGLFGILFFQDRVSTMGSSMDWHGRAHCDLIIAVISGALFFICIGPLVPFFGYHTASNWSRSVSSKAKLGRFSTIFKCISILLLITLTCISVAISLIQTQVSSNSFTAENPKRIFVQRLNVLQSATDSGKSGVVSHAMSIEQSRFTLLGVDSIPLQNVLMEMKCNEPAECTKTLARPPPKDHLLPAYPITRFMKDSVSVVVDSFDRDPLEVAMVPSLQTRQEVFPEKNVRRCHIKMVTPHAGYFVVNVTSSAVDRFSFTKDDVEPLIPSETLAGPGGEESESENEPNSGTPMYIFKHVANAVEGLANYEWNWWIDISLSREKTDHQDPVVPITWAVSNITMTPALDQLVGKLPEYVNPIPISTYLHKFNC